MSATATLKRKDALLDSGPFSRADVEMLSSRLNEPEWLKTKRLAAWSDFEELPLPTTADEAWRRTNLRKVKWPKFHLIGKSSLIGSNGSSPSLATLPQDVQYGLDTDRSAAGRLVIANNQVIFHELDPKVADQGVIFTDLSTAVTEHTELVQKFLGSEAVPPSNGKFAALNCLCPRGRGQRIAAAHADCGGPVFQRKLY
jgi:Fe-S cluster assembly protein SufD